MTSRKDNWCFRKWREKHLLLADFLIAAISSLAVIGLALWYSTPIELAQLFNGSRGPMYTTIAAITGSLLGFILTAMSIIAVFVQTPRFEKLQNAGGVKQIFRIYMSATRWLSFTTVWIIVAIVLDTDERNQLHVTAATAFIVTITAMRVFRCVWALEEIIEVVSTPIVGPLQRPVTSDK